MSEQELQIKALECRVKECHEALDIIFRAFPEDVLKDQLGEDFEKVYITKNDEFGK